MIYENQPPELRTIKFPSLEGTPLRGRVHNWRQGLGSDAQYVYPDTSAEIHMLQTAGHRSYICIGSETGTIDLTGKTPHVEFESEDKAARAVNIRPTPKRFQSNFDQHQKSRNR